MTTKEKIKEYVDKHYNCLSILSLSCRGRKQNISL